MSQGAPSPKSRAVPLLFFVTLLLSLDRNVIGALNEAIRKEWNLSDSAVGAASGVFMLFHAITIIPIGRLVDRGSRVRILALGLFVWSLFTGLGAMARSFSQLLFMRSVVGIGEATYAPSATSMVGDLFPSAQRSRAISTITAGSPVGIALSFALGGWVARHYGWRTAFLVTGLPGILCALAVLRMREPVRGASEIKDDLGERRREGAFWRVVLRIPSFWALCLATALFTFSVAANGAFVVPFLIRYYKLSVDSAGACVGLIVGVAPVLGLMIGGITADRLRRKRSDAPLLVAGFSMVIAAVMQAAALTRNDVTSYVLFAAVGTAATFPMASLVQSAMLEIIEPKLRGSAVAMHGVMAALFGALGPVALGKLSDHFARGAATTAGLTDMAQKTLEPFRPAALRDALYLVPAVCAIIAAGVFLTLPLFRRDAERLRAWMQT